MTTPDVRVPLLQKSIAQTGERMPLGDPDNEHILLVFYHQSGAACGAFGVIPGLTQDAAIAAKAKITRELTPSDKKFVVIDTGHGFR